MRGAGRPRQELALEKFFDFVVVRFFLMLDGGHEAAAI